MTEFFVPGSADAGVPDAGDEAAYRRLAELAGAVPAGPGRRIRRVAFKVGRESWTAEVGRRLAGTRPEHRRRGGEFTTTTEKLAGQATVLAIFEGTPFAIVTDAEPAVSPAASDPSTPHRRAHGSSAWANPVLVDRPSRVGYFAG